LSKEASGKFRYLQFLGSKHERKEMRKRLAYPIFPYPKGDNSRYDASQVVDSQLKLFSDDGGSQMKVQGEKQIKKTEHDRSIQQPSLF
jgi:hypothetical protein